MNRKKLLFDSFHLTCIHALGMAAAVIIIYNIAPPGCSWQMLAGAVTAPSVFFKKMLFYCSGWTRFGCAVSLLILGYYAPLPPVGLMLYMGLVVWVAQIDNLYYRCLASGEKIFTE